ncbi:DUF262 domain-containing protein [Brachybacterium muris]|uniref:DUF262 domain-containing protein n=1 Tax=Brachybacterium muris TaxID=219301 RepID=UPI0021A898E4|nr:DUF262 domain-containing protein [Brachybacterium muris]MCT1430930.1 DUF262 domain-containing protein [Brachybacterium muris]
MGFQTPKYDLIDLIRDARAGKIQLPDFQRGYVWDDERVRQLLVTVAVGHPMGVLLVLQTGSRSVHFESKPIETMTPPEGTLPDLLVLDGQQRLTSLSQALSGEGVVATKDDGDRRYFIKVADALAHPDRLDEAIVSLPASGVVRTNFDRDIVLDVSGREEQVAEGYLPITEIFSGGGAAQWALEWAQKNEVDLGVISQFLTLLNEPMRGYEIPAILLDKETTVEAVTTVFEKVNQGGVKLTVFELLTAKFAGDRSYFEQEGKAFRLRRDWERIREVLDDHPVLEGFDNDDFLQAVTLASSLHGPTATTARKEDVLKLRLESYLQWSPKIVEGLIWAAKFLDGQHVHTASDLPYPKQIVPLAVLRVALGETSDAYGVHARIRQWFWSGIFGELYGSAIETRFARDVEQVPAWAQAKDDAVVPRTVEESYFNESRLHSLRTRNSAAYKGLYALLMAHDCKDWVFNQSFDRAHYLELRVDIHHIFPKAWCNKNDIPWEQRESIVNKTPLARTTNIKLSGNAPSVYRKTIERESQAPAALIDEVVADHQIDPKLLWADDFQGFFTARREALCALVEQATGKSVTRDVVESSDSGIEQG